MVDANKRTTTLTAGFKYVFASERYLLLKDDQFALVATPDGRCPRGTVVRADDGFKLLQIVAQNGHILNPVDIENLVNGENPIDPRFAALSDEEQQILQDQMACFTSNPNVKFLLASQKTNEYGHQTYFGFYTQQLTSDNGFLLGGWGGLIIPCNVQTTPNCKPSLS